MARKGKNKECVAIARDVIKQLNAEKYVAIHGDYLSRKDGGVLFDGVKEGVELQAVLKDPEFPACEVCALGAFFLSTVRRYDKFEHNGGDYIDSFEEMRPKVAEFFTNTEVLNIEHAFEDFSNARGMLRHLPFGGKRMRLIARFIIKNNGNFDLEKFIAANKPPKPKLPVAPSYDY